MVISVLSFFRMNMQDKVRHAALNNALWCNAMCRAHGQPTEFTDQLWICRGTPPRYHSNLTTLQPSSKEAVEQESPRGFKDGFHDIDATDLGYQQLFQATWIWREPTVEAQTMLNWRRVQTDEELQDWEAGWATGDEDAANHSRQFPPSLLDNLNNAFLGVYQGDQPVAGCILNLTEPVVGLSNTFALGIDLSDLWHDFPLIVAQIFPNTPIVGYERGEDLEQAIAAGFEAIGNLRVWVRA